jgi:hypothetical protein
LYYVIYDAAVCTGPPACTIYFTNTGTANTNIESLTLTYGGTTCSPTIEITTITAGAAEVALPLTGIGDCAVGAAGEAFTGSAALSDGAQVPFSGTFASSYTSYAQVTVTSQLPHTLVSATGIQASDTGTANVVAYNLTLTYGGVTCNPTITVTTLTAGGGTVAIPITAIGTCVSGVVGEAYSGNIALSYGGLVPFSGTFS